MLEAVNSVLQNAPLQRSSADQVSPVDSFAGNPERTQRVATLPQAPFVSPYVHVDVNFDTAVLQIRDSDTGDVLRQFPSESTLQARQRVETARASAQEAAPQNQSESAQAFVQQTSPDTGQSQQQVAQQQQAAQATAQQVQAFESAARAGNANAGNVEVLA